MGGRLYYKPPLRGDTGVFPRFDQISPNSLAVNQSLSASQSNLFQTSRKKDTIQTISVQRLSTTPSGSLIIDLVFALTGSRLRTFFHVSPSRSHDDMVNVLMKTFVPSRTASDGLARRTSWVPSRPPKSCSLKPTWSRTHEVPKT